MIAPCVASSKPRNSSYREHGRKSSGHLAKGTTPSCVEVEKQELKSPSQLWTWNLTPPVAPSTSAALRLDLHTPVEVPPIKRDPNTSLLFEFDSLTETPTTATKSQGGPPHKETGNTTEVTPIQEEGRVKKMVADIEKVASNAPVPQPSSLYVSVAKPLEVWVIADPHENSSPIIFYKALETQPYSTLPDFADNKEVEEKVRATLQAEPRLVPLLEKAGIKLRQGRQLPPPPSVCEKW